MNVSRFRNDHNTRLIFSLIFFYKGSNYQHINHSHFVHLSMGNTKMGDHLGTHFVFFHFGSDKLKF